MPASSGISPRTRSCRRRTKARAPSASARVPKKIVSKTSAVWESRLEGLRLGVGVLGGSDEGERVERADHQRPLPVEEADGALGMDPAQDRALGEIAVAHFSPQALVDHGVQGHYPRTLSSRLAVKAVMRSRE